MADDKLAELLTTQKSLTEWLQDIGHSDTDKLRKEDNEKRERLKVLHHEIALPFDEPTQFEATEIQEQSSAFKTYLQEHGQELCALRLIPKVDALPKLRMRGKSVVDAVAWFHEQAIDPTQYRADFIPHSPDNAWATIFVVNSHGIQGEIIYGGHHQLTQGFHDDQPPLVFRYNFAQWELNPQNDAALKHLQELAAHLRVNDNAVQQRLTEELDATFSHNYLEGYFETTNSSVGTWFIDYSPALGALYSDLDIRPQALPTGQQVAGRVGSSGQATGPVRIIDPDKIDAEFNDGDVLVCSVTTPKYVPLMQKASAIVTDQGGILSHAAIVARELKKPCIVGTGNATQILKNGQVVAVDGNTGIVSIISK
jgi:phosphohistidine swiveling domain-containing protein